MVSTLAVLFLNPNDFETVRGDFVVSFSFFFLFQIQRASDRKNVLLLLLLILLLFFFFCFSFKDISFGRKTELLKDYLRM